MKPWERDPCCVARTRRLVFPIGVVCTIPHHSRVNKTLHAVTANRKAMFFAACPLLYLIASRLQLAIFRVGGSHHARSHPNLPCTLLTVFVSVCAPVRVFSLFIQGDRGCGKPSLPGDGRRVFDDRQQAVERQHRHDGDGPRRPLLQLQRRGQPDDSLPRRPRRGGVQGMQQFGRCVLLMVRFSRRFGSLQQQQSLKASVMGSPPRPVISKHGTLSTPLR